MIELKVAIVAALATLYALVAIPHALKTGRIWMGRGCHVNRQDSPELFAVLVIIAAAMTIGMIGVVTAMLLYPFEV